MRMSIGSALTLIRRRVKLTKSKLSELSKTNVKTIRNLEREKKCNVKTIAKIRNSIKENYNLDLYEISGTKFVWNVEDLTNECLDVIEGNLLGDASIGKAGNFVQAAKDENYLKWLSEILSREGLKCNVIKTKSKTSFSDSDSYWLYSHTCPALLALRNRWYTLNNGKGKKIVPSSIKITSINLLHWYLGDGNLKRDNRSEKMGRPYVRLYTNDFSRYDIQTLLEKLREVKLNFNTVPKLSVDKERGFVLYLHPDSLLNFFMLVGTKSPKEIEKCVTEIRKGNIHQFKDKWPVEKDWNRILSKENNVGCLMRQKRIENNLTQRELSSKIGLSRKRTVADYENNRKHMSTLKFERMLETLNMNTYDALRFVLVVKNKGLTSKNYKEGMLATDLISNIPRVI